MPHLAILAEELRCVDGWFFQKKTMAASVSNKALALRGHGGGRPSELIPGAPGPWALKPGYPKLNLQLCNIPGPDPLDRPKPPNPNPASPQARGAGELKMHAQQLESLCVGLSRGWK